MTSRFTEKLDQLTDTLDLLKDFDASSLGRALAAGRNLHAFAVGSGGSAITAEYLARCRDTLSLGPTTVQTPMQTVLGTHELSTSDIWLFSAGADNPDVTAAARAAVDRRCRSLHLLTRSPSGVAARIVAENGGTVHVVPVADPRDGYLATHSLVSAVVALLLASDSACGDPRGAPKLLAKLSAHLWDGRGQATRRATVERPTSLHSQDTMIFASDPQIRHVAT